MSTPEYLAASGALQFLREFGDPAIVRCNPPRVLQVLPGFGVPALRERKEPEGEFGIWGPGEQTRRFEQGATGLGSLSQAEADLAEPEPRQPGKGFALQDRLIDRCCVVKERGSARLRSELGEYGGI